MKKARLGIFSEPYFLVLYTYAASLLLHDYWIEHHQNIKVMIQDKNFVITALTSWDCSDDSNAKHIAMKLSQDNKVMYINPPINTIELITGFIKDANNRKNRVVLGSKPAIYKVNNNLWVIEPPIVLAPIYKVYSDMVFDIFNKRDNRMYAEAIQWAMSHLYISEHILIIDNDIFHSFYLKEFLEPELSIYLRSFNLQKIPHWLAQAKRLEPKLIYKSDIVLTTSESLAEDIRGYNYNTFNIGQGVDFNNFNAHKYYEIPSEMDDIHTPVIGYCDVGDNRCMSEDLITKITSEYPSCSIVLVSTSKSSFNQHKLNEFKNVYFINNIKVEFLAQYIAHFDICINPEMKEECPNAVYPINIDYYLAMGKPVVTTYTKYTDAFSKYVLYTNTHSDFIRSIDVALSQVGIETLFIERSEFAQTHSWDSCIDRIKIALRMILDQMYDQDDELLYSESDDN